MLTTDLDLTVPEKLPIKNDERMRDRLENGGFVIVPSRSASGDVPPKHYFQQRKRGTKTLYRIHGEFLTPLTGSKTHRDGTPRSPTAVQNGLHAEALRYLDLLLWNPLKFDLRSIEELDRPRELQVQIPRPGVYLIQKVLCSDERETDEERHKDLAYCYDVATLTHGNWEALREELADLTGETNRWSKWLDRAGKILEDAFLEDDASGPSYVERTYAEASVQNATVRRIMKRFIESILPEKR